MLGIWASIDQVPQCIERKEESRTYLEAILDEKEGHFIWEIISKGRGDAVARLLDEMDIKTIPCKIVVKNNTQKVPGPYPKKNEAGKKIFADTRVYVAKEFQSGVLRVGIDGWIEQKAVEFKHCTATFFKREAKPAEETEMKGRKGMVNRDIVTMLQIHNRSGPAEGENKKGQVIEQEELRYEKENKLDQQINHSRQKTGIELLKERLGIRKKQ